MVKKYIARYGLDISHFKRGMESKVSNKKCSPEELLVNNQGAKYRVHTLRLRRALLESGLPYVCVCGQEATWNGCVLVLQVDHKDGDWRNNTKQNLRFLCPNCHSQTDTFGFRKKT